MKKEKGFTLIELLAIIVILAIIAVITVPLILDIIDNAKEKSVIDSAYGYKKAIDQYYVSKMMADNSYEVKDDEYEISIYKNDGLTVSGEEPKDGWVKVVNGTVTDFSFLIGDYVVTYNAETNSIEAVKGTEPALTPKMQIKKEAKEAALEIVNNQTGTTGVTDITEGWVAFINNTLKAYSVSVTVSDKTFIVTDNNVVYENNEITSNNAVAIEGTEVASKSIGEQVIRTEAATEVSNYITALLSDSTISAYTKDTGKKVSEISTPTAPTGIDSNSWIFFKKETSVTAPDYSIKITKGGYSFVINSVDGTVSDHIYNGELLTQKLPPSFATDSWATIKANLTANRNAYDIGETKEVVIDNESYTVRLANTSSCPNNWPTTASQTTCGVVIEFIDTIKDSTNNNEDGHAMNLSNTNVGGWPASSMRSYLNETLLNKLPEELKASGMILDTSVVSGHGSTSGETNFISTDKLYLLSYVEVWGSNHDYDTVKLVDGTITDGTRQLQYYGSTGSTRIKNTTEGSAKKWWLRSAYSGTTAAFLSVNTSGNVYIYGSAGNRNGVAPAFRILN